MADKKTGIDQALIRDLANILKDTDLTEIEAGREVSCHVAARAHGKPITGRTVTADVR